MLEAMLNLVPENGEDLPSPESLPELQKDYLLAARVKATPSEDYDASNDVGKVITLRSSVRTNLISTAGKQVTKKGYFAWGNEEGDSIVFDVYIPHPSVGRGSLPKALKDCMALFMVKLNDEGYNIPARSIEYTR